MVSPVGGKFRHTVRLHFPASNNVTEYEALISGVFVNDLNTPSAREKPPVADKTQAEEPEHAEKAEHAPTSPAPD